MRQIQSDPLERARAIVYASLLRERSKRGFGTLLSQDKSDSLDRPWIVAAQIFAMLVSVPLLIWLFAGR